MTMKNFRDIEKFEISFYEKLYKLLDLSQKELTNLFLKNNDNNFDNCKSILLESFSQNK